MPSGNVFVTGLILVVLVFGMAFWWFQQHAFYEETYEESVEIAGEICVYTNHDRTIEELSW